MKIKTNRLCVGVGGRGPTGRWFELKAASCAGPWPGCPQALSRGPQRAAGSSAVCPGHSLVLPPACLPRGDKAARGEVHGARPLTLSGDSPLGNLHSCLPEVAGSLADADTLVPRACRPAAAHHRLLPSSVALSAQVAGGRVTWEHRSSGEGAHSRLPRGRKTEVYCCDPWAVSLPVAPCRARPSRQRRSLRLSSPQGTLIQHLKEHILHGNMTSSDTIFCYTTVSGPRDAKRGAGLRGLPLPLLPASDGFGSFWAASLWAFLTFRPLPSHVLIARSTRDPRLLVEQLVMGGLSLSSLQPFLSLWPCLPL